MKTANEIWNAYMELRKKVSDARDLNSRFPEEMTALRAEYQKLNLNSLSKEELLKVPFICLPIATSKAKLVNVVDETFKNILSK